MDKKRPSRETIGERSTTHGESSRPSGKVTKEYRIWCNIKNRCHNAKVPEYPFYGGRDITIDYSWVYSYSNFLADMGRCPEDYTLERIDNNGPYSKENCRWASRKEQARNRRNSVTAIYNGKTMSLIDIAETLGLPYHTVYSRLRRTGSVIGGTKPAQNRNKET